MREKLKAQRLIFFAFLGFVLLSYPLLKLGSKPIFVLDIPFLYVYIYLVWLFIIIATWLMVDNKFKKKKE